MFVSVNERVGKCLLLCLRGPDAESRPSKQVFLLVREALRKALASARCFWELMRGMDLFKEDSVIWWSSLQSCKVPLWFSMILLLFEVMESRSESLLDSEMAVWREWRR